MAGQYYEGVGRRKNSVARVRVSAGTGAFTVNDKQIAEYFTRFGDVEAILGPFVAINQDQSGFERRRRNRPDGCSKTGSRPRTCKDG